MNIGISAFAGDGGRSGIGQYLAHVISRLPEEAPDARFVVFATRAAVDDLGLRDDRLKIVAFNTLLPVPSTSSLPLEPRSIIADVDVCILASDF